VFGCKEGFELIITQPLGPGVYKKGSIDPYTIFSSFKDEEGKTGALLSFSGIVKAVGKNGKKVKKLVLEAYEESASEVIRRICDELVKKYDLRAAYIYHFVGEFNVGELIVFVFIASKSRNEGYPALVEAVKRYKSEPPIWKKEIYEDGTSEWIVED